MNTGIKSICCVLLALCFLCGCNGGGIGSSSKPFPFSDVQWSTSQDDVAKIIGKDVSEEYETDDGLHVLQFNDCEYDGFSGLTRYCFNGDMLAQGIFETGYDVDEYKHFDDTFTSKYGEPKTETNAGNVWSDGDVNVGLAGVTLFGGKIIINYTKPEAFNQ